MSPGATDIVSRPERAGDERAIARITLAVFDERFGFRSPPRLSHPGVPARYLPALAFDAALPEGPVRFHPAFDVDA